MNKAWLKFCRDIAGSWCCPRSVGCAGSTAGRKLSCCLTLGMVLLQSGEKHTPVPKERTPCFTPAALRSCKCTAFSPGNLFRASYISFICHEAECECGFTLLKGKLIVWAQLRESTLQCHMLGHTQPPTAKRCYRGCYSLLKPN